MANFRSHAIISIAVGAGAYMAKFSAERQRDPEAKIDIKDLLLHVGFSFMSGCLPDLLEPPSSPNHRDFFHSIAFAALGCWLLHKAQEGIPDDQLRAALEIFLLGYLSHLGADLTTVKSLPII